MGLSSVCLNTPLNTKCTPSKAVVPDGGNFIPEGHWAVSGGVFDCHIWRGRLRGSHGV